MFRSNEAYYDYDGEKSEKPLEEVSEKKMSKTSQICRERICVRVLCVRVTFFFFVLLLFGYIRTKGDISTMIDDSFNWNVFRISCHRNFGETCSVSSTPHLSPSPSPASSLPLMPRQHFEIEAIEFVAGELSKRLAGGNIRERSNDMRQKFGRLELRERLGDVRRIGGKKT